MNAPDAFEYLVDLFQHHQIPFNKIGEEALHSAFVTTLADESEHTFPLLIFQFEDVLGDLFYRFSVIPFIACSEQERPVAWYFATAYLNHTTALLKFALDHESDLELICDIPVKDMTEDRFTRTLQMIADYAGLYYLELAAMIDEKETDLFLMEEQGSEAASERNQE
jgi:hypothetical protein